MSGNANWFVVEAMRGREATAVEHLRRQEFRTFYPRYLKRIRHARKTRSELVPIFPGYIFTQFDLRRERWAAINSTWGVKRLVSLDRLKPAQVPAEVMTSLFARCEGEVVQDIIMSPRPGDRVRFVAGSLAGQIATIEKIDQKNRINVLFEILGNYHNIIVSNKIIEPS